MSSANSFKTPSADDIAAGFAAQRQAEAPAPTPAAPVADGATTQKPFDPNEDATPGFFGALKDAYNRSSLAPGNNSFDSPNIYESVAQSVFRRTAPKPTDKPKGFFGKIGADAVAVGAGLPIALSHPIETAKATFIGGTPEDDLITRVKKGAIVESVGQVFDKQYYKDHPGLAALNTGSWIATVFSGGLSKVLESAAAVGLKRGIAEATIAGAERVSVEAGLRAASKGGSMKLAVTEAMKTGDSAIVQEVVKQALVKQGTDVEVAARIATKVADGVGTHFTENAGMIKFLNAGAHPVSTVMDLTGRVVSPLRKAVFGDAANTAVGRLYGAEAVAKNPQSFLDLESWAAQQVQERGLKNTINNRETVMNDWSRTVPEWSVLSPEERLAHFQNYVRATQYSQRISQVTGDAVVPVKFMPEETARAIQKTINDAPESMSAAGILDELQQIYGSDISFHKESLKKLIDKDPTRDALAAGIQSLGNRQTLSYGNHAEAAALVKRMEEESGYHLSGAPTEKIVTHATPESLAATAEASRAGRAGVDAIPTVESVSKPRPAVGRLMERLGLSPSGGNEGTLEFLYQDNFNQEAVKSLTSKYGDTFTVDHHTVPFSKLYDYLNVKKQAIFERSGVKGRLFNTSTGVVDMTVDDLATFGFAKPLAEDIVNVSKRALTDIPFEKTGLADGIANIAKARIPGYAKFMKMAVNGRFNLNPFYGLQAWVEMEFNKAAALGFNKSVAKATTFGERTDGIVNDVLSKIPYLKDTINPKLTYSEIKMATDELLGDLQQRSLSVESNPEMATMERAASFGNTAEDIVKFNKSIESKNLMFRGLGYTVQRGATGFAKALAEKYGFTLEEALGSKMVNGVKVYNHPEVFNMLREATSDLAGYRPGFLTSPLAKTLNAIWFPFRFEAKTVRGVAEALGKMPPVARIGVMSDWTHFANWAETPEGIKWRKENSHNFYNTLNYVFAWESAGRAIGDVFDGKLFGGNVGQIGGMPFGFITNTLQNLGVIATQPRGESDGYSKRVPKTLASTASAIIVVEGLISHMFPKMPFYSLFNGNVSSAETFFNKNIIEGVYADVLDKASGGTGSKARTKFQRTQFKNLQSGENRF